MEQGKGKRGKILYGIVGAVLLAVLAFALWRIADIAAQRQISRKTGEELVRLAVTERVKKQQNAPQTAEPAQSPTEYGPVPIEVDFALLQTQNADITAWIYCPNTPINYPVVRGQDNDYYLDHMADGSQNQTGAIFLDHRNAFGLTDDYHVIHGHNQKTEAMFGTLPNYAQQAYYDSHPVLYLLTEEQNYVVELFAGFVTDSDDRLYRIPPTEQTRDMLVESWIFRSDFKADVTVDADDRLVVLSTCAYAHDRARYVVAGILREV